MSLAYIPIPTDIVRALRRGGPDAYGLPAERTTSDGPCNPCRHCLDFVPEGAGMLICAHRPFGHLQPYAETGPIFLCAADCAPWSGRGMPPILRSSPDYILRGYSVAERIVYGSGGVVAADAVAARAQALLKVPGVAFVDVRSSRNNCFQLRIRPSG